MQWLNSLLNDWGTWIVTFGGLAGLLGWAVGLPSVLKVLSTLIDVLSPIAKLFSEGFATGVRWLWRTLVWPDDPKQISIRRGVTDIADDWVTIGCVALLMWGVWTTSQWQVDNLTDNLSTCQSEVVKLKKVQTQKTRPSNDFLWPLW